MSGPHKAHVDEEDLDELDDVLEQFSAPPAKAQPTPKSTNNPSSTAASTTSSSSGPRTSKSPQPSTSTSTNTAEPLDFGADFEKELAAGMASLFREISTDAGLDPDALKVEEGDGEMTEEERNRREAFQAAWERMLVEGMDGAMDVEELVGTSEGKGKGRETDLGADAMGSDGAEEKAGNGNGGAVPEDDFQASIRKAMDKLKESDSNLQADTEGSLDDLVQKLTAGIDLGSGGESDEELQKMLENMMTQLMSKDILYEPLKEMHVKFPDYLKDNEAKISPEDKKRYLSQQTATAKIVAIFENPSYSETNQGMNAQITTLMNEMQSYGAPPAEIMGPLPPNFDLDADGMPKLPDNCVIA
ncbi:Pex19-domain-containing protein [Laetiporus sulphureus 93-53]|uniref:Pex19-domain-containing protein n=1 Tax=Laetiporus sulphureus 93-53 TaxID=1314785 RepID=A0A165EBY0_9APHY|nr:Pex19-domain-containing protein [Laetiporus sulphureus 93-53]KZT06690.1 Pex19-domain-containing protein [Laetiporus sulphureus 93-53]